jgi:hypothetical protein
MNQDTIPIPPKEVHAYEGAMLAFLHAAHAIAAQLEKEGHALAAQLKGEWQKAVLAQGSWRAAKWIASAQQQGGRPLPCRRPDPRAARAAGCQGTARDQPH